MRIRFTQMLATPAICYTGGSTHEVPDAEASRLIAGKIAVEVPAVVTMDKVPPTETTDVKKAKATADKLPPAVQA